MLHRGPASIGRREARAAIDRACLVAECASCGVEVFRVAQREANRAPHTAATLIQLAVHKHARHADGCAPEAKVYREIIEPEETK